jgi:hypothetical protein
VLHRDNVSVKVAVLTEVTVLECCKMTVILAAIAGGVCVSNYKNVLLHMAECQLFVFICMELYYKPSD